MSIYEQGRKLLKHNHIAEEWPLEQCENYEVFPYMLGYTLAV